MKRIAHAHPPEGRAVTPDERADIVASTRQHLGPDGRNIYGCTACPNCGSGCRWATSDQHTTSPACIICDDCGRRKPLVRSGGYMAGYGFDEAP